MLQIPFELSAGQKTHFREFPFEVMSSLALLFISVRVQPE